MRLQLRNRRTSAKIRRSGANLTFLGKYAFSPSLSRAVNRRFPGYGTVCRASGRSIMKLFIA